jgi:hypothetical protein
MGSSSAEGQSGGVSSGPGTIVIPPPVTLNLTASTTRPGVGKDVVVVAALEPAQAGASYRLNWGDGSAPETVSKAATHHYAKAKQYKVSASAVVGDSELNHEIVLQVTAGRSMWPPIVGAMAALAGLTFVRLHTFGPKVSVAARWGTPDAPEMKLLSREPYASLSFEPGVGPAEESITFSDEGRESGLEQR